MITDIQNTNSLIEKSLWPRTNGFDRALSWHSPGLKSVRVKGAEVSPAVWLAVNLRQALDTLQIGKLCAALKAGGLVSATREHTLRAALAPWRHAVVLRGSDCQRPRTARADPTLIEYDRTVRYLPVLAKGALFLRPRAQSKRV
jgi:hypothetical protein